MSFTLAGINDRLSKFVDEQVEVILQQLLTLENTHPQAWKVRSRDVLVNVKGSPEVKSLVQNVERQVARSIFSVRNDTVSSLEFRHDGENNTDCYSLSKLQRLPSITSSAISDITGILNLQPYDIVSSKSWPNTSAILRNSLFCNNYSLFRLSLQIHAKLTHSLTSSAIKEGFINLSHGLLLYYKKFYSDLVINLNSGIDLRNPIHLCMVKTCHLIVEAVKVLPKNWVRYGRRSVECVCESFLNLLAFHIFTPHVLVNGSKTSDCAYPFHIVSTLDPCAEWCVFWLHSSFGQNVLFVTHASLAKTLVQVCVDILVVHFNENPLTFSTIKFATLIHSANVLKAMLCYREGQKLFPVIVSSRFGDRHITINDFGILLVKYIIKCGSCGDGKRQDVLNSVFNLFLSLVENCVWGAAVEEIMGVIMGPMCASYVESSSGTLQYTVRFLNTFVKTRTGVKMLWGLGHKQMFPSRSQQQFNTSRSASGSRNSGVARSLKPTTRQQSTKSLRILTEEVLNICPAQMVIQFTTYTLKNSLSHPLLEPLLDVCGSLLELHEGVLCHSESECALLSAAAAAYRQLYDSQHVPQLHNASPSFTSLVSRNLLAFFTRVSSTPRGALLVSNERDIIVQAVRAQTSDPLACWEDARFRLVTARLLFVHKCHKLLAAESARVVTDALDMLRDVHEDPEMLTGSERRYSAAVQYFINIVYTLTSSLEGVASLLDETDDGSSADTLVDSDGPTSFSDLLTCDSFTEEWHYVALLVLRFVVTNLNVLLYLNHKINMQARLLQLQRENLNDQQPPVVVVDRCSLLRHRVLVAGCVVGGPSELEPGWPMFASPPPPHSLYSRPKPCSKTRTQLHKFLKDTELGLHDVGWVVNARRAYVSSAHCDLKSTVVVSIVEQLARCCSDSATRGVNWAGIEPGELFSEDVHGIQLAVRYGLNCGLLQPAAQNVDNLMLLVRMCYSHRESPLIFNGFTWFVATAFNLCGGCLDRCYSFLSDAWSLPASGYLQLKGRVSERDMMFGHLLEHIVATELPLAFNALQMSGVCWWLTCHQWMEQCFWNVLDWPQICHWLVVSFLYPLDYIMYYCVALLRHAQPQVLAASAEERLVDFVKLEPLTGFKIHDHLAFMEQLAKCYRTSVLQHLQDM